MSSNENTPFLHALSTGDYEKAELLLDNKETDVNYRNSEGDDALSLIGLDAPEGFLFQVLMKVQDAEIFDANKNVLVKLFATVKNLEKLETAIKHALMSEVHFEAQLKPSGKTIMHYVVEMDMENGVEWFFNCAGEMAFNASDTLFQTPDSNGETPLMIAIRTSKEKNIKEILSKEAGLHVFEEHGFYLKRAETANQEDEVFEKIAIDTIQFCLYKGCASIDTLKLLLRSTNENPRINYVDFIIDNYFDLEETTRRKYLLFFIREKELSISPHQVEKVLDMQTENESEKEPFLIAMSENMRSQNIPDRLIERMKELGLFEIIGFFSRDLSIRRQPDTPIIEENKSKIQRYDSSSSSSSSDYSDFLLPSPPKPTKKPNESAASSSSVSFGEFITPEEILLTPPILPVKRFNEDNEPSKDVIRTLHFPQ